MQHNVNLNEIYFCYSSGDEHGVYKLDTLQQGSCVQLPEQHMVFLRFAKRLFWAVANVNSVNTYATATSLTYGLVGGSYFDQKAGFVAA